jgi:Zn finger protein HypA/HybF involved in hydrogenase expression
MHHSVCTISPARATLAPFLPAPDPIAMALAVTAPSSCACGGALELEMERDLGVCVNCQAQATSQIPIHITSAGPCARLPQSLEA